MENCVKFPKSTPIEIVELYRKLDFQRRELERQRIDVQDRLLKREDKRIFMNDNHKEKEMIMKVQHIDTTREGVHYGGQEQEGSIRTHGVEERLMDSLMNSFESLNQHTNVLTEELKERSEKRTERFLEEEEAQKPYIFFFDNCLMISDFVVENRTYLA